MRTVSKPPASNSKMPIQPARLHQVYPGTLTAFCGVVIPRERAGVVNKRAVLTIQRAKRQYRSPVRCPACEQVAGLTTEETVRRILDRETVRRRAYRDAVSQENRIWRIRVVSGGLPTLGKRR